jgi:hypothetical protein
LKFLASPQKDTSLCPRFLAYQICIRTLPRDLCAQSNGAQTVTFSQSVWNTVGRCGALLAGALLGASVQSMLWMKISESIGDEQKIEQYSCLEGFRMHLCTEYGSSYAISIGISVAELMGPSSGPQGISSCLSWPKGLSTVCLLFFSAGLYSMGGARTRRSTFHNSFRKKCGHGPAITSKPAS